MPNQKGFTPLIIVIVIAVIGVVGFFIFKQGGVSLPTSQLTGRATEADFDFIDDENLRKNFVAMANQPTYRTKTYSDAADMTFVMEVEVKGEEFNTRDIEYQPKDKETKQKVQIGDTIYVKDYSDNKWWKQTIKPEELPNEDIPEEEEPTDFKAEYSKPDLKFKFLGKEACGSMMCFKYEQLNGGPEDMAYKRIFWFDDQKYLLRKDEVTVGEFTNSIEYSYDNINITAPTPTKDVPAGKSIYDYLSGSNQATPDLPADFPSLPEDYSESY